MESINPATGERLGMFPMTPPAGIEAALAGTAAAAMAWAQRSFDERAAFLRAVAGILRSGSAHYARLITLEMGKPIREARAEIEKCAWGCEYYADNAGKLLATETVTSTASRSYVVPRPLGAVLAIMPWNFPFWQVFRCAAPLLMAGNPLLVKPASSTPQCALALREIFARAGLPAGVVSVLLIDATEAERLIGDDRIRAVTLTGSEAAGRRVAAAAGAALKKSVLELGGADAFVVLADADIVLATAQAMVARFQNCGQSCIAAKRIILVDEIADDFLAGFEAGVRALRMGDPLDERTEIGPMARADLRDHLHRQVQDSILRGATCAAGGEPLAGPGYFFAPTLLDRVGVGTPAYADELFGPVGAIIRVRDEGEALRVANDSRFGLGGSVWTRDPERGERFARLLDTGMGFVNGVVHSDPRLPFGGVKASGHGRELGAAGLQEFINLNTIWIR